MATLLGADRAHASRYGDGFIAILPCIGDQTNVDGLEEAATVYTDGGPPMQLSASVIAHRRRLSTNFKRIETGCNGFPFDLSTL
jgi:hypothetical protein